MRSQTIPGLLAERGRDPPDAPAFAISPAAGKWRYVTWAEHATQVARLADALAGCGIGHGTRVAVIARTSIDWERAQMAALQAGATVIGIDVNYPDATLAEVVEATAPTAVFVDDARTLARMPASITASIRLAVAFDAGADGQRGDITTLAELIARAPSGEPARSESPSPDDPAIVVFSSGTTGTPKPIVYTHRQVVLAVDEILGAFPDIAQGSRLLCWLPLANLFQRVINFCAMARGATSYIVEDPREVVQHLQSASPHVFIGVPRFFEKLYSGIDERLAGALAQRAARWAIAAGRRRAERLRVGRDARLSEALRWRVADRLVARRLRSVFGRNVRYLISGSAPMPGWLLEWFDAIGLPVLEAYGVSENIVPVAMNRPGERRLGTVGKPMPANEVKIGPDGEIHVRGAGVFRGYPASADPPSGGDGFWPTGDLGELTPDGYLQITGRKSDAFKSSGGRWVVPGEAEACLRQAPYVEHAVVLGAGSSELLGVLNLDVARLRGERTASGTSSPAPGHLTAEEQARIARELGALAAALPGYLRPAGLLVVTTPFAIASGELTTNLKLRRQFIAAKFKDRLEQLHRLVQSMKAVPESEQRPSPVIAVE